MVNLYHPGFPGTYPNDANCYITITASNNGNIRLTVVDFYIEDRYDNLFIYRGNRLSITTLTGQTYPNYIESADILLHFQSDATLTERGFTLQAEWITEVSK